MNFIEKIGVCWMLAPMYASINYNYDFPAKVVMFIFGFLLFILGRPIQKLIESPRQNKRKWSKSQLHIAGCSACGGDHNIAKEYILRNDRAETFVVCPATEKAVEIFDDNKTLKILTRRENNV